MTEPTINYRATVNQLEDAYQKLHGDHLHVCGVCLAKSLEMIIQPYVDVAVSTGRQLQREKIVNDVMGEG